MNFQGECACRLDTPVEFQSTSGMKLRLIPPGQFIMGSHQAELGRSKDEGPQHRVRITTPFYMGVFPVLQCEYCYVTGEHPSHFQRLLGARSEEETRKLPVENVSWQSADEFCQRLSLMESKNGAERRYRLPTEAEWEYACRAGTVTPFHVGPDLSSREANFDGRHPYGKGKDGPNLERTTIAGSYQSNAFALYDVHGNVWEWCNDWFSRDYYSHSPVEDPQGPKIGRYRVFRGGSWDNRSRNCRSACRFRASPNNFKPFIGFRVVLDIFASSRLE